MAPTKKVIQLLANILDLSHPTLQQQSTSKSGIFDQKPQPKPKRPTDLPKIIVPRKRETCSPGALEGVLNSGVEYVRLFRVCRGEQVGEACVGGVKKAEEGVEQLVKEIDQTKQDIQKTFSESVSYCTKDLVTYLHTRLSHLQALHERDLARVRRACRGQLADMVARVVSDAKKHRETANIVLQNRHELQLESIQEHIFDMKRQARRRADVISKLRSQVARAHIALKKHGIYENEVSQNITDDRIRTEDLLTSLQTSLHEKEQTIKSLTERLTELDQQAEKKRSTSANATRKSSRRSSVKQGSGGARRPTQRVYGDHRKSILEKDRKMSVEWKSGVEDGLSSPTLPSVAYQQVHSHPQQPQPQQQQDQQDQQDQQQQQDPPALKETTIALLNSLTTLYETRLEDIQTTHNTTLTTLQTNLTTKIEEYRLACQEAQAALADPIVKGCIRGGLKTVSPFVRGLFPRGVREGFREVGVQCNLDPFSGGGEGSG
ncbi:uncharacterized protein SPPG_04363 [Spizellomyces punctatus DAOM BR117]|uniref:DUF4709 domain-containing protein n=1 Tax=Spizellomyces punctatus (strain DAOM BR117) TaxID=645134 RepID=A0A0L0HG59_SPIPD|nr:uncharacterized protein SPPG_04363 [Spizellomyces punctatus DAOM BR117]KND00017.1 hypothetical protein SPPG_04363 [Spizellomyces punctatus DAOM BR117]|eukprot:XP_016608056.1 hypothetical protein SPPG_04363 [Spizellomyces punctatus DAOM BR117]